MQYKIMLSNDFDINTIRERVTNNEKKQTDFKI